MINNNNINALPNTVKQNKIQQLHNNDFV